MSNYTEPAMTINEAITWAYIKEYMIERMGEQAFYYYFIHIQII